MSDSRAGFRPNIRGPGPDDVDSISQRTGRGDVHQAPNQDTPLRLDTTRLGPIRPPS